MSELGYFEFRSQKLSDHFLDINLDIGLEFSMDITPDNHSDMLIFKKLVISSWAGTILSGSPDPE